MPALWKSSERPMYVKTVWVDGFRHAILTHDDPHLLKLNSKKKRPHSSASLAIKSEQQLALHKLRKTRLSQNEDQLGECLRNLNFALKVTTPIKNNIKKEEDEEIEELNLTELETESEDELILKANAQKLNQFDTSRSKNNQAEMKTVRSNRTARTENKENNDLSERVLQWLDLAGKIDLITTDEASRIAQPRHSWPELQKRFNSTTQLNKGKCDKGVKGKVMDSPKDSPKDKVQMEKGIIDRHDFYVNTANTIENYARQSRHVRDTPSRNVRKPNKINEEAKTNVEETRQKVANEIQAMEKQYADLINKKIIPNYNKQVSKRQVHIFVPSVPKKPIASTGTSRTESLISQRT